MIFLLLSFSLNLNASGLHGNDLGFGLRQGTLVELRPVKKLSGHSAGRLSFSQIDPNCKSPQQNCSQISDNPWNFRVFEKSVASVIMNRLGYQQIVSYKLIEFSRWIEFIINFSEYLGIMHPPVDVLVEKVFDLEPALIPEPCETPAAVSPSSNVTYEGVLQGLESQNEDHSGILSSKNRLLTFQIPSRAMAECLADYVFSAQYAKFEFVQGDNDQLNIIKAYP